MGVKVNKPDKIILGIDPGTIFTGYGIVKSVNNNPVLEHFGYIDMSRVEDVYEKLKKIYDRTLHLIKQYNVDEMAVEAPFFGKNVQSMLKLGRAQGMSIAAAVSQNIPVFEYSPRKIKLSVTGNGAASKEQVAGFLQSILGLKEIPQKLDATDGLAVALCHFYQNNAISAGKSYSSWKDFIRQNPDKIK